MYSGMDTGEKIVLISIILAITAFFTFIFWCFSRDDTY